MRPCSRLPAVVLTAVAALIVAAPAADAAAPRVTSTKIVVGTSIGGVALGQPLSAARSIWGRGSCENVSTGAMLGGGRDRGFRPEEPAECRYSGRGSTGLGSFATECVRRGEFCDPAQEGRVRQVSIDAGGKLALGRHTFARPFTRFRTAKGIKLGSRVKALRRAYPAARRRRGFFDEPADPVSSSHYVIKSAGVSTAFDVDLTGRPEERQIARVVGITIAAPDPEG